jgi:hypothetical protein
LRIDLISERYKWTSEQGQEQSGAGLEKPGCILEVLIISIFIFYRDIYRWTVDNLFSPSPVLGMIDHPKGILINEAALRAAGKL